MLDLKIVGGSVIDGTGAPAVRADVGIRGGRVAAVGDLAAAEARAAIDAAGRVVCPGFIDVHSHSDTYLLIEPSAPSKVLQGVTTEVCGNCGASAAPVAGAYRLPSDWRDKTYPGAWRTVAEYRDLLAAARPAVNAVLLIGHNNLRAAAMGYAARAATPDELAEMTRLLEQALDEGGRGLSTGLVYPPGMFAPPEEVAKLAAAAARRGGIYSSHMRSEGGRLLQAIDEALAVGRQAGIRVQISHLKTKGRDAWPLAEQAIARIENARAEGLAVAADRYPYTASCTNLDVIFPAWAEEGGNDAILARVRDPATRRRLREELLRSRGEEAWAEITIATTAHPDNLALQGRPLTAAARDLGLAPVDAVLEILDRDELRTEAFFHSMSEANMRRFYALPWVMVGSDASLRAPDGPLAGGWPHPRAFGTFPRFLRTALDGAVDASLAEAVRRMTGLAAEHFGLRDRGVLAPGRCADVVVFDPARVRDGATYDAPRREPEGIDHVIVNGAVTASGGRLTGERGGRFLAD